MVSPDERITLLPPREDVRETGRGVTTGLPPDILNQAARRLRILALLYSFTFFMSGLVGDFLPSDARSRMAAELVYWIPDVVSIVIGLAVAGLTLSTRISVAAMLRIGLVFMVVSSYGIAIAEYINPLRLNTAGPLLGLSWVSVWTLLFTVMVPTRPRVALVVTPASVSSVPVVIAVMIATGRTTFSPTPLQFFSWIVFPYVLVVVLAYVCQRVIYALGREVTRARELGSYRLVDRLGQGGMGEVWRADHRLLARPAAIKLLRSGAAVQSGGADASALRRFEREAQVTAQLRSPHTVELWDFGLTEDGAFYYVMELLDGLDLDTLVRRHGPVPADRAVHVLRQVCHSLAEAQDNGLVHRDIKPANIFLCRYGGDYDFVKVLDFGIVKAAHSPSVAGGVLATRENLVHGTPAFIAPEQALGAEVDGRADIYATGCVAYWLLTGELVFTADTVMGVLMHHAHTAPTPPSDRSEQPVPPALDQLIMRCLAKDPRNRPQNARELSRRLGELTGDDEWTQERAREWWLQHVPVPAR